MIARRKGENEILDGRDDARLIGEPWRGTPLCYECGRSMIPVEGETRCRTCRTGTQRRRLRILGGEVQVKVEPQQILAALLAPLAFVLAFILTAASIGCTARHAPIRERPKALNEVLPPGVLTTINGVIYVPRGRLAEFTTEPLAVTTAAIMVHERTHVRRQRRLGGVLFGVRYATDPNFRWREERLAYEAEVAYLLAAGQRVRREDLVAAVTAPMYLGMVSREEAERWAAQIVP